MSTPFVVDTLSTDDTTLYVDVPSRDLTVMVILTNDGLQIAVFPMHQVADPLSQVHVKTPEHNHA